MEGMEDLKARLIACSVREVSDFWVDFWASVSLSRVYHLIYQVGLVTWSSLYITKFGIKRAVKFAVILWGNDSGEKSNCNGNWEVTAEDIRSAVLGWCRLYVSCGLITWSPISHGNSQWQIHLTIPFTMRSSSICCILFHRPHTHFLQTSLCFSSKKDKIAIYKCFHKSFFASSNEFPSLLNFISGQLS